MMETNVIIRYKRECNSWLCPECDTENNMSLGKCTVCGCGKSSTATILKQWTEDDERPVTTPKYSPETPLDYSPEEESNKNIIIGFVVIAIIIFVFIVAVSQGY